MKAEQVQLPGEVAERQGGVGAEDGIRTHDPLLGKEMLYH